MNHFSYSRLFLVRCIPSGVSRAMRAGPPKAAFGEAWVDPMVALRYE